MSERRYNEMMHKKKFLWVIPVVVALIVAITGVFAVPNAMHGNNQNQVALAAGPGESEPYYYYGNAGKVNELWGTDVTFGEYLLEVYSSEVFKHMTRDEINWLYATKMDWGGLSTLQHPLGSGHVQTDPVWNPRLGLWFRVDDWSLNPYKWNSGVWYQSESEVIQPYHYDIEEMNVETQLWYNGTCQDVWLVRDSDCHYIDAHWIYYDVADGYYETRGHLWGTFPKGCFPDDFYEVHTWSDLVYLEF
jgi:hypothetical protein